MNFLKNRILIVEVLGVKLSIHPVCGTPQGGVLSSRIWNLAFDPLLKLLNHESPCAPVGFADDGALCFRGFCPSTLVDIAQPKIDMAVEWGTQNGLSFSVDKTTVVNAIKILRKSSDFSTVKQFANGIFMSKLTYGAEIWAGAPKYLISKLQHLQLETARVCIGPKLRYWSKTTLFKGDEMVGRETNSRICSSKTDTSDVIH